MTDYRPMVVLQEGRWLVSVESSWTNTSSFNDFPMKVLRHFCGLFSRPKMANDYAKNDEALARRQKNVYFNHKKHFQAG